MSRAVIARIRGCVRRCTLVRETPKRYLVSVFYPSNQRTEQTWVQKGTPDEVNGGRFTKVGHLEAQQFEVAA